MNLKLQSRYIVVVALILLCGFNLPVFAEGDGYGENPGGAGGDTIIVDNKEDFKTYAALSEPYVIFIKDTIDVGSEIRISSFKTISGLDSTSTIIGNVSIKSGTNNVVIKNLNITNPANDGITIRNAQYIFVTNCTIFDCGDGCIDVTVESDFVTISHTRFYYDKVTVHKFVNLIGASDDNITDRGKLHVTFHHNWWDTGCTSRMPRVRFGYVHIYNNYYSCSGNNYCNRAGLEGHIYSEKNYFDGVRDPLTVDQGGVAKSVGNEYVNCTGTINAGNDEVFIPSYNYFATNAFIAKDSVLANVGNTKQETVIDNEKKETIITWSDLGAIIYETPLNETQLNASTSGNTSTPVYSHNIGDILPEGYNTITVTFPEDANYKAASKTVNIKVNYEYFSLSVSESNATSLELISLSPAGTIMNGQLKYPKGTVVTLAASSNLLSTFSHWQNGETKDTILLTMNEDVEVSAIYKQLNYIVAWDLYNTGSRNRPADFYSSDENQTSTLELNNHSGTSTTWALFSGTNKLFGKNAAMIRRGSSSAGDYFFQINFDATNFQNIKLSASMLGLNTYYQVQNIQYSTDGINYTKIGEINIQQDSVWYDGTFQLPENTNGSNSITVRFIADKSSHLTINGNIGTAVSEIIVLADAYNSTSVLKYKTDRNVIEKQYYSLDGKRLKTPEKGINIELTRFTDGSRTAKKVFINEIN